MTTAQAVGAVSREAAEWYAIEWRAINRNVRRLQVRIVQATKASRWGRVPFDVVKIEFRAAFLEVFQSSRIRRMRLRLFRQLGFV